MSKNISWVHILFTKLTFRIGMLALAVFISLALLLVVGLDKQKNFFLTENQSFLLTLFKNQFRQNEELRIRELITQIKPILGSTKNLTTTLQTIAKATPEIQYISIFDTTLKVVADTRKSFSNPLTDTEAITQSTLSHVLIKQWKDDDLLLFRALIPLTDETLNDKKKPTYWIDYHSQIDIGTMSQSRKIANHYAPVYINSQYSGVMVIGVFCLCLFFILLLFFAIPGNQLIYSIQKFKRHSPLSRTLTNGWAKESLLELHSLKREFTIRINEINALQKSLHNDIKQSTYDVVTRQMDIIKEEKLAAMGKMIAGICHTMNNPLHYIIGNLDTLKSSLTNSLSAKDKDILEAIKSIEQGAHRLKRLILELSIFSQSDSLSLEKRQLLEILEIILPTFKTQHSDITFAIDADPIPSIPCYPAQIEHLFKNIITNAVESIEESRNVDGRLLIRAIVDDKEVQIQFIDNGKGFPDIDASKIFDPFYTTKTTYGSGLGLAVSYGIIQSHGGKISIKNNPSPNNGAIVTVHFFI